MSFSLHKFVSNRLSRLRVCLLFLVGMTTLCIALGVNSPPTAVVAATKSGDALAHDALSGMTVVLDPGHGGYDGGARAKESGIWEKELNLQIALAVEKELKEHGASVVLTRREDIALGEGSGATLTRKRQDLKARVAIAQEANADVLLSIHLNEYRTRKVSGPQVFYERGADAGRLLSGALQKALIDELKPKNKRAALAGDYYMLRSEIPSALVECGFISNAEEEKLLLDEAYQKRIGIALAKGLTNYREMLRRQGEEEPSKLAEKQ